MKNTTLNYLIVIALLIYSNCKAQKSDFIVTKSYDTIYVDKVTLTDNEVKTKTKGKKEKYNINEIIGFYDRKENKYYERVKNPFKDKIQAKKIDRYDYRELERSYIDDYEKRIEYKFFQRLTNGKVTLFTDGSIYKILNSSTGPSGFMSANNYDDYNNKSYYISIYDSKLELLDSTENLKLTTDVYEILKVYLYGNTEIENRLDKLLLLNAEEKQIIELITKYNIWVKSNK